MKNETNKVCVYMSTYNGEKYLREQIDSILNQKDIEIIMCIRDDGSKDDTVKIIKEYIEKGCPIIFERGENVGFAKSFMQASQTKIDADYYAFSDQDDVWKKEKLARAVKRISDKEGAVLYGGNIFITDENLQIMGTWCNKKNYEIMRERVLRYFPLGYNLYGCSMVWNREMQELIWQHIPSYIIGQDVYVTMLAGAFGEIIIDKKPMILHRLHENNTAGIESNILRRAIKGYRHYVRTGHRELSKVGSELINVYTNKKIKFNDNYGTAVLYALTNYKESIRKKLHMISLLNIKILGMPRFFFNMLLTIMDKF